MILNGGSGVALNMIRRRREDPEASIFNKNGLNNVIVFKYPNFDIDIAELDEFDFGEESPFMKDGRPVETGLYIPDDPDSIEAGGSAIYLRQRGYGRLLHSMIGIIPKLDGEDSEDLYRLHLLDTTPSLDPFLLKAAFDRANYAYTGNVFDLSAAEELDIKSIIIDRTKRIVGFALNPRDAETIDTDEKHSKRFVDAIWDPSLPEASIFIEAFRIDREEVETVFSGWKGVSYYQYSFMKNIAGLRGLSDWFRTSASRPIDANANAAFMQSLDMHKRQVFRKYERLLKNTAAVFREYDAAYQTFYDDRNPILLREFLRTAQQRYWVLGFACSALFHCVHILDREKNQTRGGRFTYDQVTEILSRMMVTMGSEVRKDLPPS